LLACGENKKGKEEKVMRNQLTIAAAASALLLIGSAQAQTPAVGDSPNAATVGQDHAIARQRQINRERGLTTGFAVHRRIVTDRMLPERFAPDAEEAALAGH
jgi:hypothetical protein